ncbi:CotH kinase family protein [Streptomyces xiaopingdaonensis]|uniref:CotH kinase family protein n=1 Tax=Streptomyces xiaopingdaonensis TaxID=1565415 RepID=UPI0003660EE1|nr:CotH kinase family protein [Streptomyces xiaopingdaonensis]
MSTPTPAPGPRRLKHRIPVRLRHHWKPAAALCAGLLLLVAFFGDARISPYVTSASVQEADRITENIEGSVGLYDDSVPHSIQLQYSRTDFDKMMKEFKDEGSKDFIEADLTIDGTFLESVGIRLKGNSTLMSLRNDGKDGGQGGDRKGGGQQQGNQQTGGRQGGGRQPGGKGGGMVAYDLSADKPEELPWLIQVDQYLEGRAYQGHRQISLRPGADEQVPMNEALSLSLMRDSGQTAERAGFASVEVNDRPEVTRLMVENPSKDYADTAVDGNGVLYKARAGGSFEYKGDDPTDYEESFNQLNKKGSQDLEPVMKLIKWADRASDKEFEEELGDHVDVDSFAKYVATQNLLLNFDDMAGPGNNYLLWYDLDTKKFSVLGWDFNLTFSGDAETGPDDDTGTGGTQPGGKDGEAPAGMPDGPPEGLPEGMPSTAPGGGSGGGPGKRGGHVLKEKFLASDAFDSDYKSAYRELYRRFYESGEAREALEDLSDQAKKAGAGDKLDAEVKKLRRTLTQRAEALSQDEEAAG